MPAEKTRSFCPCSRVLNRSGKGLMLSNLQGIVVPSSSGSSNPGRLNFRLLHPEDEGTTFLQNTCDYLPVDIA